MNLYGSADLDVLGMLLRRLRGTGDLVWAVSAMASFDDISQNSPEDESHLNDRVACF